MIWGCLPGIDRSLQQQQPGNIFIRASDGLCGNLPDEASLAASAGSNFN